MAESNPPYVLQASSHPASVFRRPLRGLFQNAGVINAGDMAVTQNGTPNMSVNVAAGYAAIFGTENTAQGAYYVYNDGTVNKTIAAADPTNPRNDLIVAKVQDAEYSGATNAWSIAVVTGTPAASPSDPSVPANSITLARVRVDAAVASIVTAKITDLRGRATATGPLPVTSTTLPAMPFEGQPVYETDTDIGRISDGSTWGIWYQKTWTAYTPTLTASTTNPTLGTASVATGRYSQIGKTVTAAVDIKFGTAGTSAGSGTYFMSLPVAAATGFTDVTSMVIGVGRMTDASAPFSALVYAELETSTTVQLVYYPSGGTATAVTQGAPWAWTASDIVFAGTITYEAA